MTEFWIVTATGDWLNTVEASDVDEACRLAEGMDYELLDTVAADVTLIGRDLTAWHEGTAGGLSSLG